MKNLLRISLLVSLFSVAAAADGETIPPYVSPDRSGNFYTGLGYTYMKMGYDADRYDISGHAIMLLAGYDFHRYLAVEGRYVTAPHTTAIHRGLSYNGTLQNISLYLKPKYAIERLTLYGLLGYGRVSLHDNTEDSENSFQWGMGANFTATDQVDVFVDFETLYDDKGFDAFASQQNDVSVDSVNIGVIYSF